MLLELITTDGNVNWLQIGIGATVSFFTALLVIHYFLGFIRKYSLWPFIWYKIILSLIVVYIAVYV
jgi:undecaprenyl-diphosphatase